MSEQLFSQQTRTPAKISGMACIVVALALTLLAARPFADVAGFSQVENSDFRVPLFILSSVVVFGLVLVLVRTLIRLFQAAAELLGRTNSRPTLAVVLTLIIAGTVCVLAALVVEFYGVRSIRISASSVGASVTANAPFMLTVLAILAFLAGIALAAVGVWGSIRPETPVQRP